MIDSETLTQALGAERIASPEAVDKLTKFVDLVSKWNTSINMVAQSTLGTIWNRHVLDSAQVLQCARTEDRIWMDMGSGGGFPGIVVAVLAEDLFPDLRVTLVESDKRKATFLKEASRQLSLRVDIKAQRVEDLLPMAADVVSARALAPLTRLCELASMHLSPSGRCAFLKGARAEQELAEARKTWRFDLESHKSATDDQALVLFMKGLQRV